MNRFLVFCCLFVCFCCVAVEAKQPPNIVMIFCDDLTNQALSCYGHPLKLLETPNIDPAIASSVFVTTITDVIGFVSFLGVGAYFF